MTQANHALQQTRAGASRLQSLRPVGRVTELWLLGILCAGRICGLEIFVCFCSQLRSAGQTFCARADWSAAAV